MSDKKKSDDAPAPDVNVAVVYAWLLAIMERSHRIVISDHPAIREDESIEEYAARVFDQAKRAMDAAEEEAVRRSFAAHSMHSGRKLMAQFALDVCGYARTVTHGNTRVQEHLSDVSHAAAQEFIKDFPDWDFYFEDECGIPF